MARSMSLDCTTRSSVSYTMETWGQLGSAKHPSSSSSSIISLAASDGSARHRFSWIIRIKSWKMLGSLNAPRTLSQ